MKLFELLDQLEEISMKNEKMGSNFSACFEYVYCSSLGNGVQYFIFQVNESLVNEEMFHELMKIKDL
jgi:hypothetical protein